MPCSPLVKENKVVGFICTRGRKPKPCFYCGNPSSQLCDFPIGKHKNGKKKTCDAAMCERCTSKGVSKEYDFCRPHFKLAKEAYERRMQRSK